MDRAGEGFRKPKPKPKPEPEPEVEVGNRVKVNV